jgi:large-conductance mechanosensitive channel
MYYKDLANLECVVTPAAASLADVTWKVDAPDGLFTNVHPNGTTLGLEAGVMDGEATITATAENKSASIKVKVVSPPVTALYTPSAVRLSPTSDFGRKPTETLSVTRKPTESTSPITYTSSDTNIATVDANGVVTVAETALKYGTFIQTIIDFLIIALTLFIVFKIFNFSKKKMAEFSDNISEQTEKLKKKLKKKKGKKEEVVVEEVKEEVKIEPQPITPPPPTNDEIMISLLTDIRNNLNNTKK